jgi:glycosyltransferase involved in cell wall biosynthesis
MGLFTVIIPNYNHGRFLHQRITSVLDQTYPQFEVIILDDASSDNSRDIIETYRQHPRVVHIIYSETNSGSPFRQWKKGVEAAKGEWIWIAESDDIAEPGFLETAARAFHDNPSAGLFYCDGNILDESDATYKKTFSTIKNQVFNTSKWSNDYLENGANEIYGYLKFENTINSASGMAFRKELFATAGSRIDWFTYYGDWYFYIHLLLSTDVYYSSRQLYTHRRHKKSLLNAGTALVTDRTEYFMILHSLYRSDRVGDKKNLLNNFCHYYLTIGLTTRGAGTAYAIIKKYFRIDSGLALKVLPRLLLLKVFKKMYVKHLVIPIDYKE